MSTPVWIENVVRVGQHIFCVTIVVLHRHFNDDVFFRGFRHDSKHISRQRCLCSIQILNELHQAIFKVKLFRPVRSLIAQSNSNAGRQERELTHTASQSIQRKLGFRKDRWVRQKGQTSSRGVRSAELSQL